jgi:hypothetical protein
MRIWSLLNSTGEELRQVTLSAGTQARLGRQLETLRAELEGSVSPTLAGGLRRLIGHDGTRHFRPWMAGWVRGEG